MSSTTSTIVCRAPRVFEPFRVRPGGERRAATLVAYDPSTGEPHLVTESLWHGTPGLIRACLRACVSGSGERFIWCIPFGAACSGGPHPELLMADTAEHLWVTRQPACGSFEVLAEGTPAEPGWEDFDFLDALHEAFRGRLIASDDHPVLVAMAARGPRSAAGQHH
jgi:hypothetical protein